MVQANSIKPKIIVITGTTASGKSGLAVLLAKRFSGEIISADSVQVYKGFDIGSGKITTSQMQGIAHYNIDMLEPNEEYSAGKFCTDVERYIQTILSHGKLPIIVGGTTMYIKAWMEGFSFYNDINSIAKRQKYIDYANEQGISLHTLLSIKNKALADKVHPNNQKRILRYLQIADAGEDIQPTNTNNKYDILAIKLDIPREKIYENINARVDEMFALGMVEETRSLYNKYGQVAPLGAIDYKEVVDYLDGKISLEQAIEKAKQHSRNYAKRQLTFMRTMPYLVSASPADAPKLVEEFLNDQDK